MSAGIVRRSTRFEPPGTPERLRDSSADANRVSLGCPTSAKVGKTVVTLMKKHFFRVSERNSPSATPSTVFSSTLVSQTERGSNGTRGRLNPH